MNHHVNNVKYVNWMLEVQITNQTRFLECARISEQENELDLCHLQVIPCELVKNYQLSGITLEYRKECGRSDVVQSLCDHEDKSCTKRDETCRAEISQKFTHLLQITGKSRNEEIVRGRTIWRRKT